MKTKNFLFEYFLNQNHLVNIIIIAYIFKKRNYQQSTYLNNRYTSFESTTELLLFFKDIILFSLWLTLPHDFFVMKIGADKPILTFKSRKRPTGMVCFFKRPKLILKSPSFFRIIISLSFPNHHIIIDRIPINRCLLFCMILNFLNVLSLYFIRPPIHKN